MNSAERAMLVLSLDPEFQAGSIGLPGRDPSANPRSRPRRGVLVRGRHCTRPDPWFFRERNWRMVS
jgi:hypothetical protein